MFLNERSYVNQSCSSNLLIKCVYMKKSNNIREKIIKILRKHPEGLTIVEITKEINMSRNAVTKYVYQLLGEGSIFQREVGTAKLCYLKGKKYGKK